VVDSPWLYRAIAFIIFAGAWQWYATYAHSLLFPNFFTTAAALKDIITEGTVWHALYLSNQALFYGFIFSVLIGVPFGLLAARIPLLDRIADPYLAILLAVPMASVVPLLIMSVGTGLTGRIVLVMLFTFPTIIMNSRAGVRLVATNLVDMADVFGASEMQLWWRVLLPGSLPSIMTGIRLGLGRAVTGMVTVELLMVAVGVGGLILDYDATFQSGKLYALVVLIVLEALILIGTARIIERRLTPWSRH
jgi:NitT/TauT family transport system permease protein